MKKTDIKTSFDLFVEILKLEKDECAYELFQANECLERINLMIKDIKLKIVDCEKNIRDGADKSGKKLDIHSYELVRNNLVGLGEELSQRYKEQEQAKDNYNSALEILQNQIRKHNKVIDKQFDRRLEILQEMNKDQDNELDDLCAQREWMSNHG